MTGILCIDKPHGITSFSAVSRVSRLLSRAKCGHVGTLDPMATGVLPVLIGGATKFADYLPNHDKAYRAVIRLGITTDTLDITGTVLSKREVTARKEDFENILPEFRGSIEQIPPMYSAVSQNGMRLYDLARKGIEVERKKRNVTIYSLELADFCEESGEYTVDVHCSKGTYIRTLSNDIGEALGCGAVLISLRRTLAAGYSDSQCISLEEFQRAVEIGNAEKYIRPVESAFTDFKSVFVTDGQAKRFQNGGALALDRLVLPQNSDSVLKVFAKCDNKFLGLGEICAEEGALKVKRLLVYGD